jgi:proteic killer suppression protein
MKITFADKKLEKLANDDWKMISVLGKIRAKILKRRLTQLADATNLEEVRNLPGNYHELTSNRKGQWGCDLDQPYRLVFIPHENPIPINADGLFIWLEISGVEIIAIINYHKET